MNNRLQHYAFQGSENVHHPSLPEQDGKKTWSWCKDLEWGQLYRLHWKSWWRFNLWHIKHYEFLHNQGEPVWTALGLEPRNVQHPAKRETIQLSLSRKAAKLPLVSQTRRRASSCFPSSRGCQGPKVLYIVLNQSGQECLEMKIFRHNSGDKTNQIKQDIFSLVLGNITFGVTMPITVSTIFFLSFLY